MQSANRHGRITSRGSQAFNLAGTNLERASDYNQRVTLQAIRVNGPITRVAVAKMTGLTTPAIANIVHRLQEESLVVEVGRLLGRRGQPAMRLAINPDGCFSIGVNIDRDHVTVVAVDLLGNTRARSSAALDFALPDEAVAFSRRAIDAMIGSGKLARERIIGIGVALPDDLGRVDAPNRPSSYSIWSSIDIARLFADVLPLPVFVENDTTAAAIGELQFGHGLRNPSFFYVLIGTSLGGGLVIEGNYVRGAHGHGGEIGFLPLRSRHDGAISLQEAVSLPALYRQLNAADRAVSHPEQLAALDAAGQAVVSEWIEACADHLTDPLIAVSCLVNPQAVFLGGRLPCDAVDRLAAKLNERLQRHAGNMPVVAPVLRAATAADAAAVGAAIVPISERLLPSRTALMKAAMG